MNMDLAALLLAASVVVSLAAPSAAASADTAQQKTVMAWIEGNLTEVSDFVLRGKGKGAVEIRFFNDEDLERVLQILGIENGD